MPQERDWGTDRKTVERPLKIVIAGGGTGGHVQPAVATVRALRRRVAVEPLWIGSRDGLERQAAQAEQIPFRAVATGKLRRYLSFMTLVDAVRVPLGVLQALGILRRERPDVVFATGGFVSVPSVVAARLLAIPALSHEQTATAGLATKINARFCDVVALAYETSTHALAGGRAKTVVTGNPIRAELLAGSAERAYTDLGLDPSLPLIYVTGGALGAQAINHAVRDALPDLLRITQVVHQCGPSEANGDYPELIAACARLEPELKRRYVVRERLSAELADVYAAARLVIGRAGAGTVAELATLGKPSILIPLPGSGGDEQTRNARVLADEGAAILLPQSELSPRRLVDEVQRLLDDPDALPCMGHRALRHSHRDAADRLAELILSVARARMNPPQRTYT